MDDFDRFIKAKKRFTNAKNAFALAEKELKESKLEMKNCTIKLHEILLDIDKEIDEPRPTTRTAIVEVMEKDLSNIETKFITIEERYKEKCKQEKVDQNKISAEEKEIFESKIKPQLLKIDVEDLKKIGLTREAVRNWFAKGSNPSKQNYDKLVTYFGIN